MSDRMDRGGDRGERGGDRGGAGGGVAARRPFFRRLNKLHPLVPLAVIAAIVVALGWAIASLLA